MKTVGDFYNAGLKFVSGDECVNWKGILFSKKWVKFSNENDADFVDCTPTKFAWRTNTGEKPEFVNGVNLVDWIHEDGSVYTTDVLHWDSNVKKWRPSLNQSTIQTEIPEEKGVGMKTVVDAVNEFRGVWPKYEEEDSLAIALNTGDERGEVYIGGLTDVVDGYSPSAYTEICRKEEFNQCVAEMSEAKWIPESKPVFTQAMADAGELPPVGSDYLDEDGQLCLCIGYSSEKGFVVGQMVEHPSSNGYPPISTSEKTCVRPIKSDCEKAIDDVTGDWPMADKSTIEIMHDIGYRKLTPSQAKSYDDKAGYFSEGE